MKSLTACSLGILALVAWVESPAQAGWAVGVNVGVPAYRPYYPCYRPYYPYYPYRPYSGVFVSTPGVAVGVGVAAAPVAVAAPVYAAPVYAAPVPVVVQSAPAPAAAQTAQPPLAAQAAPLPPVVAETAPPPTVVPSSARGNGVEHFMQALADPNERVRSDTVMQLGRLRVQQAVDPLAATLAGDQSPAVREAAARALGLIGSPKALPALQRAAQVDNDREVRHSAQFAIEVIQTRP